MLIKVELYCTYYNTFNSLLMQQKQKISSFNLEDKEIWITELEKTGCVVLKNIIQPSEVDEATNLFWEWLQTLGSGINRNDPETWVDENWPGSPQMGFFVSYGGCHTKASWYLRTKPNVAKAFEYIWNTKELISSFDTFICWRPWWNKFSKNLWNPFVENLHVDQNPKLKKGFHCVQGMIPLKKVSKDAAGGLMVVPNTNNDETQNQLSQRYPGVRNGGDWLQLRNQDPYMGKGILVECDPGDLILWDSRTIHGGKIIDPSPQFKQKSLNDLVRLSLTVTMTPREKASKMILEKRKNAFDNHIGLTHWPHEFMKSGMGTMTKNISSKDIKYQWPKITPQIEKLI